MQITELVVTLMYTWEEYAGNQNNLNYEQDPQRLHAKPLIVLNKGEDIVHGGRKLSL